MYIYTFELKLSSENYLVFPSLLKFISLYCLYDLKLWFIVFEILVTTAQKTNSLTCSYTGLKKTYVGEVTIQMLKYYRNLLEKRFFSKIGGNNTTNNSFINIVVSLFCQFESTVSDKSVQISVIQLIFKRKNGQLFIIIDPL